MRDFILQFLGRFHGVCSSAIDPPRHSGKTNRWGTTLKALKFALLGSTFLVGVATAASAADVYGKDGGLKDEPYAYAPITWAGFYVGGHVGATVADSLKQTDGDFSEGVEIDNALAGGVHVGYNWQTPSNWVYGIEADLGLINDDVEDIDITDFLATIRGRVGIASGDSLLYATAGVAFLGYSDDVVDEIGVDDTAVGFVVGGGFEHKLSSRFSVGVEGLYYNFSSDSDFEGVDVDRDFWEVRARATYHFNASGHEAPLK